MRIVSLLPAATEIVAELGLLDSLVGVSHECDYPPSVKQLPQVLKCPMYDAGLTSAEIDQRVRDGLAAGTNLYEIDVPLLTALEPDVVLTQMLCDVCAIGFGTVAAVVATLPKRPQLLNLEPRRLDDMYGNIREVAQLTGTQSRAEVVIAAFRQRVTNITTRVENLSPRPRVLFLEWIVPLFKAGHWTPELIELAGGHCIAGTPGVPSSSLQWQDAVAQEPDRIVIACCGFNVARSKQDLPVLMNLPGWNELPAVHNGDVYVIDGSQYFNRSGPRLIDSLEMLAAIIHPELFERVASAPDVVRLSDLLAAEA